MVRKMRLLPLIGATYFMVAGGPYGLEDVLGKSGYGRGLLLLLVVPVIWSLPTALMVGELASAMPEDGGYYVWVRRALGPFWGFQNAWLSLAASVFDMAIYPVLFVTYLGRLKPELTAGHWGTVWALAVVVGCAVWNLRGARSVGNASLWLAVPLLSPFVVLVVAGVWQGVHGVASGGVHALSLSSRGSGDVSGALAVCLFSYMGWDNASTVAQEVDRPQRTYPLAMLLCAGLTALTYGLPTIAVAVAGVPVERFSTGAWADAAALVLPGHAGVVLALFVVLGGTVSGVGLFNALMMSYTRVPYALAEDRLMPAAFLRRNRAGVPWVSVLVLAVAWSLALGISFEGLVSLDVALYGGGLMLEFLALAVLRVREPEMPRPFRMPGGMPGAVLAGVLPAVLIGLALFALREEKVGSVPATVFAAGTAVVGPLVYWGARRVSAAVRP